MEVALQVGSVDADTNSNIDSDTDTEHDICDKMRI